MRRYSFFVDGIAIYKHTKYTEKMNISQKYLPAMPKENKP